MSNDFNQSKSLVETGFDYVEFLKEIKNKILSARIRAYHKLNRGHIQLYWDLDKTIVDRQKKYG
jgi:hypothetical protein